ncbi:NAD-dependent epimerase/dehydratase family protein [Paenibacillus crassostreae]|uniref:Epimerase n=1 Tax=Paenibacillus crassostreae TaxID=1763538 RepID=A0A167FZN7_9BACL|nr:NAD-dependent epimerase/dehydratase family protein [Paenibacillus crassostreae]AOZ93910.1 epimerase [Paenibacillus crassostreae]OAB77057.1 epimerase [Paenibacillus crassostreae]
MQIIFGTGALGLAVMRQLLRNGEKVIMVNRGSKPQLPTGVKLVHGDASDEDFCKVVCRKAKVIYNCTGLPYSQWETDLPRIQHGIIEGAASSGAKLIYADNLYAYGPPHGDLHENLQEKPVGAKTKIRSTLSEMVLQAHKEGRIQAAIGRGSDFYGPHVQSAMLGERVFNAALAGKPAEVIGDIDQPHTHIFIDDFARALVILSENEESLGQVWHMPAAETISTRQLINLIYKEVGQKPKVRIANGFLLIVMGWFVPMMREFKEIMYMMNQPFKVDHGKFDRAFEMQVTPHSEAIQSTVAWYRGKE